MNNSSGDPVSLEFLIFFHFVFSITFSSQDCPSTVSVKQMLLLFPCSLLFTVPLLQGRISVGRGMAIPCSMTVSQNQDETVFVSLVPAPQFQGRQTCTISQLVQKKSACEDTHLCTDWTDCFPILIKSLPYCQRTRPALAQVFCLNGFFSSRQ